MTTNPAGNFPGGRGTTMKHYFAVFTPDTNGMISVWFPDVPEAVTCGEDLDDAMEMAADSLKSMLEAYAREGRDTPEASGIEAVRAANADFCAEHGISAETSFYPLIAAPNLDRTTVHLSVSMPKYALEMLDRRAKMAGMTRSGYITSMATGRA